MTLYAMLPHPVFDNWSQDDMGCQQKLQLACCILFTWLHFAVLKLFILHCNSHSTGRRPVVADREADHV